MAIELGELLLSLRLDASEAYQKMEEFKANSSAFGEEVAQMMGGFDMSRFELPTIKPTVDHQPLVALNAHIDEKIAHVVEANRFFTQNPLKPRVDNTEIDAFSDRLNAVKDFIKDDDVKVFFASVDESIRSALTDVTTIVRELNKATSNFQKIQSGFSGKGRRSPISVVDPNEELLIGDSVQQDTIESIEVLARSLGGVFAKELEGSIADSSRGNVFGAIFQLLSANASSLILGLSQGIGINFGKEISDAITQEFDIDISGLVRSTRDELIELIPKEEIRERVEFVKEQVKEFAALANEIERNSPPPSQSSPPPQQQAEATPSEMMEIKRSVSDDIAEFQRKAANLREAVKRSELLINSFPEKGQFLSGSAQDAIPDLIAQIDTLIDQEFGSESGERLIDLKAQLAKLEKKVNDLDSQAFAESTAQSAKAIGRTFTDERRKARSEALGDSDRVRALQQIIDSQQSANDALDTLLESVGDGADQQLKKAIATARGQITRAVKSAKTDIEGFDIGSELVAGQNAGIQSAISSAEDMARQVAKATTQAAKDENQIQSPSKVWQQMGQNLVEGQLQGMEDRARDVYEAAEDIAKTATEKAASVQINDSAFQSDVGQKVFGLGLKTAVTGQLPERDELRTALLDIIQSAGQDFASNPIKSIQEGFERQEAFLRAYATGTGRESAAVPEVIGDAFTETVEGRGLIKELLVNSAGLSGSIAAGPLGSVAGISADIGGALITRKAVSDLEAFRLALDEVGDEFNGSFGFIQKYVKALEMARKAMTKGADAANDFSDDLFSDFAGGVVGNLSAEALQAAGSNVPLQGAAVAISSVGAIAEARQSVQEGEALADASTTALKSIIKNWVKLLKLPAQALKAEDAAISNVNAQVRTQRDSTLEASGINPAQFDQLVADSGDLEMTGQNIVESLAMGLSENGMVTAEAVTLAASLVQAFKDQLQIASPSKVFMRLGEFIVDGLRKGLETVQNIDIGESIKSQVEDIRGAVGDFDPPQSFIEWKDNLKGLVSGSALATKGLEVLTSAGGKLISIFAGFKILEFAVNNLLEFSQVSIEAAISFERVNTALSFTLGSAQKAGDAIAALRADSNRLGIDAQGSIEGFLQLAASARGTSLEGSAIEQVEGAASQASSVFQLTSEQSDRVTLALSQMSSKGKISSEELRQQLGEVLPGAFQIAARSIGVTTAELDQMLRRGEVLSEDFLPKFAQQLSAETASGVAGAANTAQASINRFNNALFELQVATGQELLPIRKLGLDVLATGINAFVDVAPIVVQLLGAIAAKTGVDLTVAAFNAAGGMSALSARFATATATGGGLITTIKGTAASIASLGKTVGATVAPYVAMFAAFEAFGVATRSLGDLSGDFGGFAEEGARSFDAYLMAVEKASKANDEFVKSLPNRNQLSGSLFDDTIIGKTLGDDAARFYEDFLLGDNLLGKISPTQLITKPIDLASQAFGRDGIRSFAERQAEQQAIARDEFLSVVNSTISESYGPDIANAIDELSNIDAIREGLIGERRNTRDADKKSELGKQIDELNQRRETVASQVSGLSATLATQRELLEEQIAALQQQAATGGLSQEDFSDLAEAENALEALTERQNDLNNKIAATISSLTRLSREFAQLDAQFADVRLGQGIEDANRNLEAALAMQGRGENVAQMERSQTEIERMVQQIATNRDEIAKTIEKLNDADIADAFEKVENVDRSLGANEILQRLEAAEQTDEVNILRNFAERSIQLSQLEAETINLDAELVTAQDDLRKQARDLAIQYRDLSEQISDFYRDALRSAEDVATQIVSQDFQNATQEISNRIRRELLGLEDSFVSGIGDTFTGLIESLRQPLLDELEAIGQRNDATRQLEDSLRAARDLQRQADELDFQSGLGPDPAAGLATPQSLGQSIDDNFITTDDGRRFPKVINLTAEQAFGGGSFLGEASAENKPISFGPIQNAPQQAISGIRNDDIAAANELAQRSRDEQLSAIDRNLAAQADTAATEAQTAIASIARQLEEGRRTIDEQSRGFSRTLRGIGEGIGRSNPLRELELGLLAASDQFQDTNREIETFKRGLRDTITETSTVRQQLLEGVASGDVGQEALSILPELDATIADSQAALSRADAQIAENRDLLEQQRAQLARDFREQERTRRRDAQRRIIEGRSAIASAQIESRTASSFSVSSQQRLERDRLIGQAEQESISIALEFDANLTELDELAKTGQLTKLEYGELKDNLMSLNEIRLDGLRNQFESLRPTVESITSALGSATGEFDENAFDQIRDNLRLAERSGALTGGQAEQAEEGLLEARRLARGSDRQAIESLLTEDNAFTSQFLSQIGRGDLVSIADLGIQNREANRARNGLSDLPTNPQAFANELTRPEFAQPNVDPMGAFSESSDRLVGALDKLTETINAGQQGQQRQGVTIQQQNITVSRDEERIAREVDKRFNQILDSRL